MSLRGGIDLGGTKIQGVVVDERGEVVADAKRPSPQSGGDAIAAAIVDVVEQMGGASDLQGIGIGAPGVIDREHGVVLRAPNLSISADVALTELVSTATGVADVRLDNDVNVATIAEHRLGAARSHDQVLCVFAGTGVGGGLVLDGRLRRGPHGLTGEIGHTVVVQDGRRCGCGGLGHLEAYAGRRCMEAEARRRHQGGRRTALVEIAGDATMKSSTFSKALAAGDEVATELLGQAADALGTAFASAAALVDLDLVVLGGGLADKLGGDFIAAVDAALQARLFVPSMGLHVVPAALGDLGGAVGAALLVT